MFSALVSKKENSVLGGMERIKSESMVEMNVEENIKKENVEENIKKENVEEYSEVKPCWNRMKTEPEDEMSDEEKEEGNYDGEGSQDLEMIKMGRKQIPFKRFLRLVARRAVTKADLARMWNTRVVEVEGREVIQFMEAVNMKPPMSNVQCPMINLKLLPPDAVEGFWSSKLGKGKYNNPYHRNLRPLVTEMVRRKGEELTCLPCSSTLPSSEGMVEHLVATHGTHLQAQAMEAMVDGRQKYSKHNLTHMGGGRRALRRALKDFVETMADPDLPVEQVLVKGNFRKNLDENCFIKESSVMGEGKAESPHPASESSDKVKGIDQRKGVEFSSQALAHACKCRDASCRLKACHKMKGLVSHSKQCQKKKGGGCAKCKRVHSLSSFHAKLCQEARCPVPFCLNIEHKS